VIPGTAHWRAQPCELVIRVGRTDRDVMAVSYLRAGKRTDNPGNASVGPSLVRVRGDMQNAQGTYVRIDITSRGN